MKFENTELERYSIIKNDLLICEGGDVGRCCVWNQDETIYYQNALHRVRLYQDLNPYFFMYYIMTLEAYGVLKRICSGVTIKHLTGIVLSKIPFAIPPLAEQNRIVEAIEKYFSIIDSISETVK